MRSQERAPPLGIDFAEVMARVLAGRLILLGDLEPGLIPENSRKYRSG
jgi:hypothetical protein